MTSPTITPPVYSEAVEAARAEIVARGEPDPFTGETVDPLPSGQEGEIEVLDGDDQVSEVTAEQDQEVLDPQEGEDSEDSVELLGDLEIEEEEAPAATPDSFVLPGIDEPVSLEELKNGYLRQADYTRKTQELSRGKEQMAKANQLWDALTQHPQDLARQLAVAAGFIEEGATPIKVVDLPFRSDEDIASEVERRVEEALASHPDILEARDTNTQRWVEGEFTRIEKDVFEGKPLGPKSRELILKEAVRANTDDLEMVARALKSRQDAKARDTEKLKRSAPVKPTGKASSTSVTEAPDTAVDAVLLAAEEAGISIDVSKLNFK